MRCQTRYLHFLVPLFFFNPHFQEHSSFLSSSWILRLIQITLFNSGEKHKSNWLCILSAFALFLFLQIRKMFFCFGRWLLPWAFFSLYLFSSVSFVIILYFYSKFSFLPLYHSFCVKKCKTTSVSMPMFLVLFFFR